MDEWRVGLESNPLSGKLLSSAERTNISCSREKCFLGFSSDTAKPGGREQQQEDPAPGAALCREAHSPPAVIVAVSFQKPPPSCRSRLLP